MCPLECFLSSDERAQPFDSAAGAFACGGFVDVAGLADLAKAELGFVAQHQGFPLRRWQRGERAANSFSALFDLQKCFRTLFGVAFRQEAQFALACDASQHI